MLRLTSGKVDYGRVDAGLELNCVRDDCASPLNVAKYEAVACLLEYFLKFPIVLLESISELSFFLKVDNAWLV